MDMGYRVMKVYEVYHWDAVKQYDKNGHGHGLFSPYINAFFKLKHQASGWPAWCQTEEDRQKYIQDFARREGILLEYDKIQKNNVRRPELVPDIGSLLQGSPRSL